MIIFENKGVIDELSIITFGVSSKDNDSAIGYFGTGLKYAIAVCLREKQEITIYSGNKTYEFTARQEKIRNDLFDIVLMNGQPIGFTTDLGKNWELWQAFRELYCNAKDEFGTCYQSDEIPDSDCKTIVAVKGVSFVTTYMNRDQIIIEAEPDYVSNSVAVYNRPSTHVYYKGIKALELDSPSNFTYNLLSDFLLTEDRTIKDTWAVSRAIGKSFLTAPKESIKTAILDDDHYESSLNFDWDIPVSNEFHEVVAESIEDNLPVNHSARTKYFRDTKVEVKPKQFVLNHVESNKHHNGIVICQRLGFDVTEYEIVTVEFLGENILGKAENGNIFIAKRAYALGDSTVASTLLEEYIHLKYGYRDESRNMQNFLFETIISLAELLPASPEEQAA